MMMEKDEMQHTMCNDLHQTVQKNACKYLHLVILKK
jgi:hypothetical protein